MKTKKFIMIPALLVVVLLPAVSFAAAATLDFSWMPSADCLSVVPFTSADIFNDGGTTTIAGQYSCLGVNFSGAPVPYRLPGALTPLGKTDISGNPLGLATEPVTTPISIAFDIPQYWIYFDLFASLGCDGSSVPITLRDAGDNIISTSDVNLAPEVIVVAAAPPLAGRFVISSGTPFSSIDFDVTDCNGGYVIDNLTFTSLLPVPKNTPPVASSLVSKSGWDVIVEDTSQDAEDAPGAMTVTVDCGAPQHPIPNPNILTGHDGDIFTCTYTYAGSYVIRHKVKDSLGLAAFSNAPVYVPVKYTVEGTITRSDGTTPIYGVILYLNNGTRNTNATSSRSDGTFRFTNVVPGNYSVRALKAGYTFANPVISGIVVSNGNVTGQDFSSIAP